MVRQEEENKGVEVARGGGTGPTSGQLTGMALQVPRRPAMKSAFWYKSEHEHSGVFNNRSAHPLIFLSTAWFGWPHDNMIIPIACIVYRAFVRSTLDDKPIGSYHLYRYSCDW